MSSQIKSLFVLIVRAFFPADTQAREAADRHHSAFDSHQDHLDYLKHG